MNTKTISAAEVERLLAYYGADHERLAIALNHYFAMPELSEEEFRALFHILEVKWR